MPVGFAILDRSRGWKALGPRVVSPAERRSSIRLRVARSVPIASGVKGRPVGARTRAPALTQRSAKGTSVVMTMSPGPAWVTIQSSAWSRPSVTVMRWTRGDSGVRSQPLATTKTRS